MQNMGLKTPILRNIVGKIKIVSTRNFLCRKFAAVGRKISTSCPAYFFRATAVPAGTAERVLAMAILSVCLSVCPTRPGGEPSPGEIEILGLHHTIA